MKKDVTKQKRSYKERYDLTRHPDRIRSSDVIEGIFENLSYFNSPDPSLVAAKGSVDGIECIIVGQEKRRTGKESKATGMVTAKGHAYIMQILDVAEKGNYPVVSFVDTFGGNSSMQAELDGQSFLISDCISRYCEIKTPTISYVIGEGGSGGALAVQVADYGYMLENGIYSVIAPESCSRIIFHRRLAAGEELEETLGDALDMLRPGAGHIKAIGMIDEILPEPEEGAHTDFEFTYKTIKDTLVSKFSEWYEADSEGKKVVKDGLIDQLVKERREKVLNFGEFFDTTDDLEKRIPRRNGHNIPAIDIERENFHMQFLIKAHLEKEGIEDTELYNCEKEWDESKNLFRVAGGCGYIPMKEFKENYYACPKCGKGEYLSAEEQIDKIADKGTFLEIEKDLTTAKMYHHERYMFGKYKAQLEKLQETCFSNEALVTGTAKVNGRDVVLAVTDLKFIGGSFGAAFGEKFKRAVDYAAIHKYPFISVCSSGGARMNEGPMSLAQMAKMNMALIDLKKEGVLYLSVIPGPTTGGAYASYVTQGDVILGEKGALVEFAGPRVVLGAGFDVDREIVNTTSLHETGKIQHNVHRKELKENLSYYVNIYYDLKYPESRRNTGRIRDFRFDLDLTPQDDSKE